MSKRLPGVSYKAEDPIYELFITVRSTSAGTAVSLTYSTRLRGDEPGQGHRWRVYQESPKPARSLEHLLNLAAWAARQALAKRAVKLR